MLVLIGEILDKYKKDSAQFIDIRHEIRRAESIQVVNGTLKSLSKNFKEGVAVRALVGESWGLASTTNITKKDIESAIQEAIKIAKASGSKSKRTINFDNVPITEKSLSPDVKIIPSTVDIEEKTKLAFELDKALKIDERIVSTSTNVAAVELEFNLVNSLGTKVHWPEIRTIVSASAVAREGERTEFDYNVRAGTIGWEIAKGLDLEKFASEPAKGAIELLSAKQAPSGMLTVVSDGDISGLLAHEVMGHASEADEVVKRRSFLTDMVGKQVGSELVNMVDDGTIKDAYGSIPFDSEGTPSSRTVIIENGIYKGYMHSLETAAIMGVKPTGNGRAQDFNRRVFVRMTNTLFLPGDWKLDEIIAETKDGLLAIKGISGMEDVAGGGVQARSLKGYIIKNGELKELVRGFSITGKALEILKTVDAVSKEKGDSPGTCGKGEEDWVSVTSGGPYMRAKMIIGGG